MMKILSAIILAAALLMTGCGGGETPAKDDKYSDAPIELHVSAAASLTNAMNDLAELYSKDNPNVKIILTSAPAAHSSKLSKTAARLIYFIPPRKSK